MKTYNNADEAYRDLSTRLAHVARRHLFNKYYAIDAVHDAFEKTCTYVNKQPGRKISGFIIIRELMRACRRINQKGSKEIPTDFSSQVVTDRG